MNRNVLYDVFQQFLLYILVYASDDISIQQSLSNVAELVQCPYKPIGADVSSMSQPLSETGKEICRKT